MVWKKCNLTTTGRMGGEGCPQTEIWVQVCSPELNLEPYSRIRKIIIVKPGEVFLSLAYK